MDPDEITTEALDEADTVMVTVLTEKYKKYIEGARETGEGAVPETSPQGDVAWSFAEWLLEESSSMLDEAETEDAS